MLLLKIHSVTGIVEGGGIVHIFLSFIATFFRIPFLILQTAIANNVYKTVPFQTESLQVFVYST